jgi:hypothetical protein
MCISCGQTRRRHFYKTGAMRARGCAEHRIDVFPAKTRDPGRLTRLAADSQTVDRNVPESDIVDINVAVRF